MNVIAPTEELVTQFQNLTLPKAAWTHQAHLQVGLWHVLQFSPDEALTRLRSGIRALNESHGNANTDQSGYHETITQFWVLWIAQLLARMDTAASMDAITDELIRAASSNVPLQYYSRELLFSVTARLRWVEPDLRPLGK